MADFFSKRRIAVVLAVIAVAAGLELGGAINASASVIGGGGGGNPTQYGSCTPSGSVYYCHNYYNAGIHLYASDLSWSPVIDNMYSTRSWFKCVVGSPNNYFAWTVGDRTHRQGWMAMYDIREGMGYSVKLNLPSCWPGAAS